MKYLEYVLFFIVFSSIGKSTPLVTKAVRKPQLFWNVTATSKTGTQVLNQVIGSAEKGKLHAIIGSSGSGKTTLLNVLAGSTPKSSISLSGELISSYTAAPIFVQQEDLLFAQLTVGETLETSVTLKSLKALKSASTQMTKDTVDGFSGILGLKKTKNTKVGDAKTRGISGGEKKRLSIGNELIGDNEGSKVLIFCDEPTSGLDSFQAQRVMQLLKDLTLKGNTVIASIHQPRNSIYAMFDEITLMSEGCTIFSGATDEMTDYFTKLGFPCPPNTNPAEYYVDLVSINYSSHEDEEFTRNRILSLAENFRSQDRFSATDKPEGKISCDSNDLAEQQSRNKFSKAMYDIRRNIISSAKTFGVLFVRAWKQVTRDKALNIARLCSNVFSALLFGAIYFQMGDSAATVPDRLGLLQVAAVNTAMTALIKATTSFVAEKLIVQRERRYETYPVGSYFLAKLAAEVPLSALFPCLAGLIMYKLCGLNPAPGCLQQFLAILTVESMASTSFGMAVGSLASSVESAIATAPALMVIFIVFGGLYVVNTPWYLKWVPKISLIRWAYEALCINEFTGLKLVPQSAAGPLSVSSGEQVLDSMGFGAAGGATIGRALRAQATIIAANYLFTYLSLILQKPSFERLGSGDGKGAERVESKVTKAEGLVPVKSQDSHIATDGGEIDSLSDKRDEIVGSAVHTAEASTGQEGTDSDSAVSNLSGESLSSLSASRPLHVIPPRGL